MSKPGRTVLAGLAAVLLLPLAPASAAPLPAQSAPSRASGTTLPQAKKSLGSIEAPTDQALRKRSKAPVTVRLKLVKGTFSYSNMQYAQLYAPWFWGWTYLGAPAPTPGVLKCKYKN